MSEGSFPSASVSFSFLRLSVVSAIHACQEASKDMKSFMCDREKKQPPGKPVDEAHDSQQLESKSTRKRRRRVKHGGKRAKVTPKKLFLEDSQKDAEEPKLPTPERDMEAGQEAGESEDLEMEMMDEFGSQSDEDVTQDVSEDADVFADRFKPPFVTPAKMVKRDPSTEPSAPSKKPRKEQEQQEAPPGMHQAMVVAQELLLKLEKPLRDALPLNMPLCLASCLALAFLNRIAACYWKQLMTDLASKA